jgi:hypothetical protein
VCDLLLEQGVEVLLTRESGEALAGDYRGDLEARAAMATTEHAAFISLHGDSAQGSGAQGIATLVHGDETSAAAEQARRQASRRLAEALQEHLVAATGARNRGVRNNSRTVLALAQVPAAEVNLGFLSNPKEAARLARDEYQERLAEGLSAGILAYLSDSAGSSATVDNEETPPLDASYRWLTVVGAIEFNGETKTITGLAADAWVILEERTPEEASKILLKPGEEGEICFQLVVNDRESAGCGARSPAWFRQHLSDYLRDAIVEDAPGPSDGGANASARSTEGIRESFFWIGSKTLRESDHAFLPPARAIHGDPENQASATYRQEVSSTLQRAARLRSHGVLTRAELIEALRERLDHEALTDQGREVWREALENSELPEIQEATQRLEEVVGGAEGRGEYPVFDPRSDALPEDPVILTLAEEGESMSAGRAGEVSSQADSLSSDRLQRWATLTGDIRFLANYAGLQSVADNGRLVIVERTPEGSRQVVVTSEANGKVFRYSERGCSLPFGKTAQTPGLVQAPAGRARTLTFTLGLAPNPTRNIQVHPF